MFNTDFYFGTLRNYVAVFGTLFAEINVTRTAANSSANSASALIRVPITYASKEKMLARVQEDPDIDRKTATLPLPMMSFDVTSFAYDGRRKLESASFRSVLDPSDPNSLFTQFTPVPYDIGFDLYVYAKNELDGNKIVEQILPYFTPDYTVSVVIIPQMGFTSKLPVILTSVAHEDDSTGKLDVHQPILWTLSFVMKAYFFGPVKESKVIKFVDTNYWASGDSADPTSNAELAFSVTVSPGLDANGNPTSNAAAAVNASTVFVNSDFGYVTTVNANPIS